MGNEDPYDSDSDTAYHFPYFVQDWHEARIMRVEARLTDARALRAASAMEYCDSLQSSSMMPDFQDISSLQQTFTWTGGGDTPDSYFKLLADSHAAIDSGEQEATPANHAVISDQTTARTGGENGLSDFGENTDTPSTQLRMVSDARVESDAERTYP